MKAKIGRYVVELTHELDIALDHQKAKITFAVEKESKLVPNAQGERKEIRRRYWSWQFSRS